MVTQIYAKSAYVKGRKLPVENADVSRNALIALAFLTLSIQILQIYNEERRRFSLVRNQPRKIVEKVATDIEKLLAKKRKALDVSLFLTNMRHWQFIDTTECAVFIYYY